MNEDMLPLPSVSADHHPMHEMQLGKSLYIVRCHYRGKETLDDKMERLVLRMLEDEAPGSR